MGSTEFVDVIQRSLSPQMSARGFGPGGPGWAPDGSPSFLYCVGAQVFAARWPSTVELLRTRTDVKLDRPEWCLDFVVEASASGHAERVDFEFVALDVLLRAANLDDLARRCTIDQLRSMEGEELGARLVEAVESLMPLNPE